MLGNPKNNTGKPHEESARTGIRVAFAGNPNSGKTTLFNAITGSRQHVGNYPGVTVERKDGVARHSGQELHVLDLPGIYDLTPGSIDERVACEHLVQDPPDVVVGVVDCTNLERNLYLAVQLRELGVPLVLAFTMSDLAEARGIRFDIEKLSARLKVPIVPVVSHRRRGIATLLDRVVEISTPTRDPDTLLIDYGADIEAEIDTLQTMMAKHNGHMPSHQYRWHAVKLLEEDPFVIAAMDSRAVSEATASSRLNIETRSGVEPIGAISSGRYRFITEVCDETVSAPSRGDVLSERLDRVLTHRIVGLPIFFALMFVVFQLTFTLANPMADAIEVFFAWLGVTLTAVSPFSASSPLMSMLVDGVIGGVGGVLVFLPNIVMLFLAISILEDSGYMARAAFMMDRLMSRVGLHGKSFIPMLLGLGCSVPAIMATRTLDSHRDRLTTMLVVPLMSCSARLTIYALIIPAFFAPHWQGPVLWLMYVIGIALAITVANILRSTLFSGEKSSFIMELPPYHLPKKRTILVHVWSRAQLYLRKAGTVILGVSILLWALTAFPRKPVTGAMTDDGLGAPVTAVASEEATRSDQLAYSIVGRIGHAMEPVIRPMGFDWKIGTALVGAFAAKEVFVAQMGIVYAVGEGDHSSDALRDRLRTEYPPLVGFCILLFALIATPCMATVAIMRRESNSWRWAFVQFGSLTVIGYVLTTVAYQVGRFLGIGI